MIPCLWHIPQIGNACRMPDAAAWLAAVAVAAACVLLAGWSPPDSAADIRTLEPRPGAAQCNYELLHAFARLARQCRKQTPPCWYTLGAGTLIGALRNEPPGLLQWEHDVDVYVPARSAAAILDILERECAGPSGGADLAPGTSRSRACGALDFRGLVDRAGAPCCSFGFKLYHRDVGARP